MRLFRSLSLSLSLVTLGVAQVTIPWADVDKAGSSLADLTVRSAGDLSSGTLPDDRLAATIARVSDVPGLAPVQSVAGRTGAVTLTKADVGLTNVDDTADTAKPVSAAQQTALDLKLDESDTTLFTRTFLAALDAATARTTLGLGTLATQSGTFSGTHSGTSSGTNTGDQTITLSGDGTGSGTGAITFTLATVNSNVGSYGSATAAPTFTVDGKGRLTAAGSTTVTPAVGSITGLGTGVATALAATPDASGGFLRYAGLGSVTQAYDADLGSIAGNTSGGFLTRTASNTYTPRTITGTANQVTVTNGDGVIGPPVIGLPNQITLSNGTITVDSRLVIWAGANGGSTYSNIFVGGSNSGGQLVNGISNFGLGYNALNALTDGSDNLGLGVSAGNALTTGSDNVFVGSGAGGLASTTGNNVAIGSGALAKASTGTGRNTGIGSVAGNDITTGSSNVTIGYNAGDGISTGTGNTIIGASLTGFAGGLTDYVVIGSGGVARATFNGTYWSFTGGIVIPTSTPASASAAGVAGTITWDSSYIYVCTATNTWKRVAIATW